MRSHHAAIAALLMAASTANAQSVKVGAPAPEIDLPALRGPRVKLSKLRGHPVIVSFWATWCGPCRQEFPELVHVHSAFDSVGLYVVGVNGTDQELSTEAVQKFVAEFSVPFLIALDKRGSSRARYLIRRLPTTVFIDSGGIVRRIDREAITRAALDSGIAAIVPPH